MAYGVDSGAVMAASVFITIRILTKMVWSQGGHIKRRLLHKGRGLSAATRVCRRLSACNSLCFNRVVLIKNGLAT